MSGKYPGKVNVRRGGRSTTSTQISDLIVFMPDPRSEDTVSFSEPGEEEEEEERGAQEKRYRRRRKRGELPRGREGRPADLTKLHQGWTW